MNCSARSTSHLTKNLADSWWQIPPFGKDFQPEKTPEIAIFAEFRTNEPFGTDLV
jgi:hypothetical protein